MAFIDAPTNFYIGRRFDPQTGEVLKDEAVYYDSRDLTTHGLIVGMTGSGKTGMALGLLEEAILDGIPLLMIDPKGDLGNLMLTFPNFQQGDFQSWIQDDEARRENTDVPSLAAKKAEQWKNGLADWEITPERMQKLQAMSDITIYTPGSESGVPISILASLKAPKGDFDANAEAYREQISSTVTAILSLAGIAADPMQDPRHVLVANIFEQSWRKGQDLSLEQLISQVQKPPFDKLGVMAVEDFFPSKERFGLAMALNAVIAAPSFASWLNGAPMDIQSLLYTPDGKPRVAIFYIAHLNDTERMFVMTLILETLLNWTRQQAGTSSLRAILYIDEIFGFFPPIANPPSKEPMLRMLKQARAYGVGVLMATQNPMDLDYKGLGNMGTWFIGRLQSDNDRERVLAGLQEAAASSDMDLGQVKQLISNLKSRIFLMRNIHNKGVPTLFSARWAMSYLAGPFTRQQISTLMTQKKNVSEAASIPSTSAATMPAASAQAAVPVSDGYSPTPPVLKDSQQFYLPAKLSAAEAIGKWEQARGDKADSVDTAKLVYIPALLAQVRAFYDDAKSKVKLDKTYAFRVEELPESGFLRWSEYAIQPLDKTDLDSRSTEGALYGAVPSALADSKRLKSLANDLEDTIYKDFGLTIQYSELFNLYSSPDEDPGVFETRLRQVAREKRDGIVDEVTAKYDAKIEKLEDRRDRKLRELEKDEARVARENQNSIADIASGILGMLGGRRSNTALTRIGKAAARTVGTSAAEVSRDETQTEIAEIEAEVEALKAEMETALQEAQAAFDEAAAKTAPYIIKLKRSGIEPDLFALAWTPHYLFTCGGQQRLAAADL
jgi:hypothetical protein